MTPGWKTTPATSRAPSCRSSPIIPSRRTFAPGSTSPDRILSKADHHRFMHRLQDRISDLQVRVRDSDRSVLIAIEGPDESGKSTVARRLLETLDPRGFRVWHTYAP